MTDDPNVEIPAEEKSPWAKLGALLLIMVLLVAVVGFEMLKDKAGRYYLERKIPSPLTKEKVIETFGTPDKICGVDAPCLQHIKGITFFSKSIPEFASFMEYHERYPILPIMVFYLDDAGNISGYDFGRYADHF